jgi:predicted nucleic acid-binding protein
VKGIADTGFLVAFANARDAHHDWAVNLAKRVTEPLLTCEAVLAETAFHLGNVSLVLEMIETGLITVAFHADDHLPHLKVLAARYRDRSPDLADLCLIRMSELFPRHTVITVDREDFRAYRRNKREVIPVCTPANLKD